MADESSFQRGKEEAAERLRGRGRGRGRSGSWTMTVYQPETHGGSPGLPAVIVEDTTGSEEASPVDGGKIMAHTARPPVELMQDA